MKKDMLREDLLASFQDLQNKFDDSREEAKQLNHSLMEHTEQLHVNISSLLTNAQNQLPDSSPLSHSLRGFISGLKTQDKTWKAAMENQNKGLAFREGFEDSLLVYVYGKVKSGKSSLGNYISQGHINPDTRPFDEKSSLQYVLHDSTDAKNGDTHNEAARQGKFRIGATEATSSIQSFRLPGLTWVDSPGLHSVQTQNGALAKEYVRHADLILYTMKSDAPGRASDLKEIAELAKQEKNIMLLLTGSDTREHGWDKEKNEAIDLCVMKSLHDRNLQQQFIRNELKTVCPQISHIDILSLSAQYAELHANNPLAINDSGMGALFTRLHQVSQENGIRMKRAVPMLNFKNFLINCLTDVDVYQRQTREFSSILNNISTEVENALVPLIRQNQSAIRGEIQAVFDMMAASRDDEQQINKDLKAAKEKWDRQALKLVNSVMDALLAGVITDFKSAVVSAWTSTSISLPDFSVAKITEQIPGDYSKSTRGRNGGIGGILGAGIGFALGGPIGAAAGGALGSGLGAITGENGGPNMRTIEITVGDNLNAIREQVINHYLNTIETDIRNQVTTQLSSLLNNMEVFCHSLNMTIQEFKEALNNLKINAEQQLDKKGKK